MPVSEKLAEEPYPVHQLLETPLDGLSLLTRKLNTPGEVEKAISMLENKPGDGLKSVVREIREIFFKEK